MSEVVIEGRPAPLVYVLTVIRFQQLEALPSWIAEIQNALRERLPVFHRFHQENTSGQIGFAVDPPDFKADAAGSAWIFSKPDRSLTVQIAKGVFIVHTRNYNGYVGFADDVQFALAAFMSSSKNLDVDVIGIRYLNHLQAGEGKSLSDILPESMLPHAAVKWNSDAKLVGGTSFSFYDLEGDKLRATVWTGTEANVIPDDLLVTYITGLKFDALTASNDPPINKLEANEATLDSDALKQYKPPQRMDANFILGEIERLHTHANKFFRATTDQGTP